MVKKMHLLFLLMMLGLSACGTLKVTVERAPLPGIPVVDVTSTPPGSIGMDATPTPAENQNNASPTPNSSGYTWNGTTLSLQGRLPDSPAEANVYRLQPDQHATLEAAVALAGRFGIQGEIYQSTGELPGMTDYIVTDGKQWMSIRSDHYFTYYADYSQSQALPGTGINTTEAAANIEAFLKSHGFNFKYKVDSTDMWGNYYVTPLTPDGFAVHFEDLRPSGFLITLDDSGQVASVQANLVDYQPAGTYAIRNAEAAWKILLDSGAQSGKLEFMYSPSGPSRAWQRTYPLDQTQTIYSHVSSYPSAETGKAPLILVGMYTATGNLAGLDQLPSNTFVEATGQFVSDGGITKFRLDTWKATPLIEDGIEGTLEQVGGQVCLSAQEGNFQLADVPADIPLPFKNAFVIGVRLGITFDWTSIDNRGGQAGGGGGGGQGFYKINLSGTPVPLPTPIPTALPPALEKPANQPDVTDQPQATGIPVTTPTTATVEKVELVYFVSDPRYITDPNAGYPYLQPTWRFYGHYSSGQEFEVLIQALQDDYLLPELAPYIQPG